MMDETTFGNVADQAFARLLRSLDTLDPDDADVDTGGGYLTITFRDGSRCVINSQRPARQIWMAADQTAWHFSMLEDSRWVAEKTGEELFATMAALVQRHLGQQLLF